MDSPLFYKNVISMFLRLTGYHIMTLLVSVSILAFLPDVTGGFVAQFIDLGIIIVLPYLTMWKKGDSDNNKINYGHMAKDNLLGLKIGLIAYLPCMIMGILLIVVKAASIPGSYLNWYRFLNTPFLPFNQSLMPTTLTFAEQKLISVVISGLTPMLTPINLGIAYYMGVNRISFSSSFGFQKKLKSK